MTPAVVEAIAMPAGANTEDPAQWAPVIMAAWGDAVASVIKTGRLLAEAKAMVAHGEWERLVGDLLPFGDRCAQSLMRIAAHDRLSNHSMLRFCRHHGRRLTVWRGSTTRRSMRRSRPVLSVRRSSGAWRSASRAAAFRRLSARRRRKAMATPMIRPMTIP